MNRIITLTAGTILCAATAVNAESPSIAFGSFDLDRGGYSSWAHPDGWLTQLRPYVRDNACPTYVMSNSLTPEFLQEVDVLVLMSPIDGYNQITPLSEEEQDHLLDFVMDGGSAILCTDNDEFDAANQSIVAPFGLHAAGTIGGDQVATVTNAAHQITDGACGLVTEFASNWPGSYDDIGPATVLATWNANGSPALAVIDAGKLGPDSGRVIFLPDHCGLVGTCMGFTGNLELALNVIGFAAPEVTTCHRCLADLDRSGSVDVADLLEVILKWGACPDSPACCDADVDGNGVVEVPDLVEVIVGWGACQ